MNVSNLVALAPLFAFVSALAVFVGGYYLHRSMYAGQSMNLANAKKGEVYHFVYQQPLHGEPERFLARVERVRELTEEDRKRLDQKSRYRADDPSFLRSQHLVTCRTLDGRVRSFYAERTAWARRPLFAGVVYRHLPTFAAYML